MTTYLRVSAKLLEINFYISLFSNCRKKVMKSRKIVGQICPIFSLLFRTFSLWLETIDKLKCSSDNMSKTRRYVVNMEHCQNYISVYHSHPIAGRRSEIVFKHTGSQSVTYILPNKYRKKDNLDFNWFENTIAFSLFYWASEFFVNLMVWGMYWRPSGAPQKLFGSLYVLPGAL